MYISYKSTVWLSKKSEPGSESVLQRLDEVSESCKLLYWIKQVRAGVPTEEA